MNFFGFIDETGILKNSNQPFFALGLLRLKDTSMLLQEIMSIKARYKGILNANNENFEIAELKFNKLKTQKYLELYKEIIKVCLKYDHFYFSARIIDKEKFKNNMSIDT